MAILESPVQIDTGTVQSSADEWQTMPEVVDSPRYPETTTLDQFIEVLEEKPGYGRKIVIKDDPQRRELEVIDNPLLDYEQAELDLQLPEMSAVLDQMTAALQDFGPDMMPTLEVEVLGIYNFLRKPVFEDFFGADDKNRDAWEKNVINIGLFEQTTIDGQVKDNPETSVIKRELIDRNRLRVNALQFFAAHLSNIEMVMTGLGEMIPGVAEVSEQLRQIVSALSADVQPYKLRIEEMVAQGWYTEEDAKVAQARQALNFAKLYVNQGKFTQTDFDNCQAAAAPAEWLKQRVRELIAEGKMPENEIGKLNKSLDFREIVPYRFMPRDFKEKVMKQFTVAAHTALQVLAGQQVSEKNMVYLRSIMETPTAQ